MSEIVKQINERNRVRYGPQCIKCDMFAHSCRCTHNDPFKNRDLTFHMQRVFVKITNSEVIEGKVMEAPIHVLARDMVEQLKTIEMCGKTVDEVMKYALNNFDRL